jgi:DNA-binding transcriptional ArsR family regulator
MVVGVRPHGSSGSPAINGALALGQRPRQILDALALVSGLNIDEIAAVLGVRRTAANHHVRTLARRGLVVRVRQGRHLLHFLQGESPSMRQAITTLRIPSVFALAQDLFHHPQDSGATRALRLDVSERQVRRALRVLQRHELVRLDPQEGRTPPLAHLHPDVRLVLVRRQASAPA